MNKKGAAIGIVAVVLALVILTFFLVNLALRECNSNRDCPANAYCGTDYECHEYPKEVVVNGPNFIPAALILAVGLIVAAYIFKGKGFSFKEK